MPNLAVTVVSIISLLLIISAIVKLVGKYTKVPFTVLLVIVGFLLSYLSKGELGLVQQLTSFKIYPDLLLYVCLPTLIFEAAFTMDGRLLNQNLLPVLTLAIPGIFVTSLLIGVIVSLLTPMHFMTAFLLGAILSATDSVAVIAIFRQVGVPKRLAILVEGESLFNSSTAFLLAKTIIFMMVATKISTSDMLLDGIYQFLWNFFGGIAVGLLMTWITGFVISLMEDEILVVISLTVILAYLSFIVSENIFHVSGIMATITAGIIMADWGRTKFSPETEKYIRNLLGFFAYIVNSLIFLLVGFSVNATILINSLFILFITIIAMLIARAAMVFGLIPMIGKLSNSSGPINLRYQVITWWGGIQGAIGLTIALGVTHLPDSEHQMLISIVMGVVLFTILLQGSLMSKLVHWLSLDKQPLSDQLATVEAEVAAEETTLARIPDLLASGLFSLKIAQHLKASCDKAMRLGQQKLLQLKKTKLNSSRERKLLYLSCFSEEKYLYYKMFCNGHLSEQAYRVLNHAADMKIDSMRYRGDISKEISTTLLNRIYLFLLQIIKRYSILYEVTNRIRIYQSIHDYEEKWGDYQGNLAVLKHLEDVSKKSLVEDNISQEVKRTFLNWLAISEKYLNDVAEQFPEFVNDMQKRFAKRLLWHSRLESITHQEQQGLLPQNIANRIIKKYMQQIRKLSKGHPEKLKLDSHVLLRQVPFFQNISDVELEEVIKLLKEYHAPPNDIIIRQDTMGDAMYIITRGVVRVIKEKDHESQEVATLLAGDFFGELALLHRIKRTATCKTVTPCILYALNYRDFELLCKRFPHIQNIISEIGKTRLD